MSVSLPLSQVLCLEKQGTSDQPSCVQVRRTSDGVCNPTATSPRPPTSQPSQAAPHSQASSSSNATQGAPHTQQPSGGSPVRGGQGDVRRSSSSLAMSSSHKQQAHRESMSSLASDSSLPCATQELQNRLRQLQK